MKKELVRLENVSFRYGSQFVLENINLTIEEGDFLGVVGPNGSGKSTMLRIILGLLRPSAGKVYLFGKEQKDFRDWPRLGYVAQKATSFSHAFPATVTETVKAGLTSSLGIFRRPGKREQERVEKALREAGVEDLKDRPIGELSGGQQQRVFIARAMVAEPKLLILDEPTVGVDAGAKERFYALLNELHLKHNLTLIMVTHDIGAITTRVKNLACLNKRLFYHGPPGEFCSGDALQQAYGDSMQILHHKH